MTGPLLGAAVGRRRVATGLLTACALPVLGGCDAGEGAPDLPTVREDPDEQLVGAALAAERSLLEAVRRTRARHRSLRRALRPTLDVHRAHVALLTGSVAEDDPAGGSASVPRDPATALTALVRHERSLADDHVRSLVRARSGALARLLAVMAAASQQQAAMLSRATPRPPGGGA